MNSTTTDDELNARNGGGGIQWTLTPGDATPRLTVHDGHMVLAAPATVIPCDMLIMNGEHVHAPCGLRGALRWARIDGRWVAMPADRWSRNPLPRFGLRSETP
jgi:hypothetical protein